jgi:tRNA threonylcarbamoyladenosine biosynthesis protein TsaB
MPGSSSRTTLAIDTSGPLGSVAVGRGGAVLTHGVMATPSRHAAGLLPLIDDALGVSGITRHDLSDIVVGEGPGSFTGVRVAAATVKGLSRALDLPVYAVSSLAAVAMTVEGAPLRYVLFDARSTRVYAACFEIGAGSVRPVVPAHATEVGELLRAGPPTDALFVGDGAEKHRATLEAAGFTVASSSPDTPPAVGLLRFLATCTDLPPVAEVGGWEPEYLRPSSAERLWMP